MNIMKLLEDDDFKLFVDNTPQIAYLFDRLSVDVKNGLPTSMVTYDNNKFKIIMGGWERYNVPKNELFLLYMTHELGHIISGDCGSQWSSTLSGEGGAGKQLANIIMDVYIHMVFNSHFSQVIPSTWEYMQKVLCIELKKSTSWLFLQQPEENVWEKCDKLMNVGNTLAVFQILRRYLPPGGGVIEKAGHSPSKNNKYKKNKVNDEDFDQVIPQPGGEISGENFSLWGEAWLRLIEKTEQDRKLAQILNKIRFVLESAASGEKDNPDELGKYTWKQKSGMGMDYFGKIFHPIKAEHGRLFLDVSGSMSDTQINKAITTTKQYFKEIFVWSTECYPYSDPIKSTGGTDPRCITKYVSDEHKLPDVIITDGYFDGESLKKWRNATLILYYTGVIIPNIESMVGSGVRVVKIT